MEYCTQCDKLGELDDNFICQSCRNEYDEWGQQYYKQDKARDSGPLCTDCGCPVEKKDAGKCDQCLNREWVGYAPGKCKSCGEKEPLLDSLCRLCHEAFTYTMQEAKERKEALSNGGEGEPVE